MHPCPPFTSAEAAAVLGAAHHGPELLLRGVAELPVEGALAARWGPGPAPEGPGALLCRAPRPSGTDLVVADPRLAFARLLAWRFADPTWPAPEAPAGAPWVHPDATVHPSAALGPGVRVHARAAIGPGCALGAGTEVFPGAVLCGGTQVGARCRIGPGAVLGYDGFAFAAGPGGPVRLPHLGRVVLEDDVEIGANTTVDRGTLGETRIGRGAKLDNLVQVGHNAQIGPGALLAGQVGLSGSARVGAGAVLGGQAGVADHVAVGAGARVGAQSGVMRDVPDGHAVWGSPAAPLAAAKRAAVALLRLGRRRGGG